MYTNSRNLRVSMENGVEEHDGDIRFKTRSGNMAVSFICNASGHNYSNSSFIVDLATGQTPRPTECISSFYIYIYFAVFCVLFYFCTVFAAGDSTHELLTTKLKCLSLYELIHV